MKICLAYKIYVGQIFNCSEANVYNFNFNVGNSIGDDEENVERIPVDMWTSGRLKYRKLFTYLRLRYYMLGYVY